MDYEQFTSTLADWCHDVRRDSALVGIVNGVLRVDREHAAMRAYVDGLRQHVAELEHRLLACEAHSPVGERGRLASQEPTK